MTTQAGQDILTAEESSLSSFAGPYVTEMLGRGQALASMPYQAYMGPLTAGQSTLQDTAFQGLGALGMPTASTAGTFTGDAVTSYMSPYLQGALDPQYAAAQRQSDIAAQKLQSQFGKAGAYGGSRQGVAEAELQRGLLDRMANITGAGYQTAFEQAQQQFNKDRGYGLDVLREQQTGGGVQRAIEGQGIAADIAQFEQERDYPKSNTLFMQSLLQGLPLETQSYSYYEPTGLASLSGGIQGMTSVLDVLSDVGSAGTGPAGGYTGPNLTQAQAQAMQNQYQVNLTTMAPKEAMEAAMKQFGFVI